MRQFITSMSREGYELYGKEMLERAQECLPGELVVYTEDEIPDPEQTYWRDLNEVEGFRWFLDRIQDFPMLNGVMDNQGGRNYRYDVVRFCRKSFAQIHAATANQDEMWWIDADVTFKQPIPESFFEKQLKGVFMAYLGRPGWHSCASLVGWNNAHKQAAQFWSTYFMVYMGGNVFGLQEWHDSYLLDVIRKELGLLTRNMAQSVDVPDGPANVFDLVLGEYAHHKKGNIKHRAQGPSRYQQLIDIVAERQPKTIMEIGTWNGDRAVQMCTASPGARYIGFDLFEEATDETDAEEKNVKKHHTEDEVSGKLTAAGITHTLHKGNTRYTLPKCHETDVDLVWLDGGHSRETIESDLNAVMNMVRKGGIVLLDDYYEGMPEEHLRQFGCQNVLQDLKIEHKVLPIADPVQGGGVTKVAVIEC